VDVCVVTRAMSKAVIAGLAVVVVVVGLYESSIFVSRSSAAFGSDPTTTAAPASPPPPPPTWCMKMYAAHRVEPGSSWGTLPAVDHDRWRDDKCDEEVEAAKKAKSQNPTQPEKPQEVAPPPPPPPAPKNPGEEWCRATKEKHQVQPGLSWGTLPKLGRKRWIAEHCDRFVAEWVQHLNGAADKLNHPALRAKRVSLPTRSTTKGLGWCEMVKSKHHVQPGTTWGSLSEADKERWVDEMCDLAMHLGRDARCDDLYSSSVVEQWWSDTAAACSSDATTAGKHSQATCYLFHEQGKVCVIRNAVLNMASAPIVANRRTPAKGTIRARCAESGKVSVVPCFQGDPNIRLENQFCTKWERTPTLLFSQRDGKDLFSCVADLFEVWLTLQALDMDPADMALVSADGVVPRPPATSAPAANPQVANPPDDLGPYLGPLLSQIFGHGVTLGDNLKGVTVCYDQMALVQSPGTDTMWLSHDHDSKCSTSAGASELYRSFVSDILTRLSLRPDDQGLDSNHVAVARLPKELLAKLPPAEVADNVCSGAHKPGEAVCIQVLAMSGSSPATHKDHSLSNAGELVSALRGIGTMKADAPEVMLGHADSAVLKVLVVDPTTLSIVDQMRLVLGTQLLVGLDASRLALAGFMPSDTAHCCGLVEMTPRAHPDHVVANFARHAGVLYKRWNSNQAVNHNAATKVDVAAVVDLVKDMARQLLHSPDGTAPAPMNVDLESDAPHHDAEEEKLWAQLKE